MKRSPLNELAHRISEHLKRFESDPAINRYKNPESRGGTKPYYNASACQAGRYVGVRYISYQDMSMLTKAEAERYLDALDGGFIGRHHEAFRLSAEGSAS